MDMDPAYELFVLFLFLYSPQYCIHHRKKKKKEGSVSGRSENVTCVSPLFLARLFGTVSLAQY